MRTDPEAAKYVIESGIPVTALGLDVTMRLENAMAERLMAEGNKNGWAFQFLERAVAFNLKRGLEPYSLLVDAMAVAAAVRPEIAEYIHGKAAVSDQDRRCLGQKDMRINGTPMYGQRTALILTSILTCS